MSSKKGVKVCITARFHQFSTPPSSWLLGCSLLYRDSNWICASILDIFLVENDISQQNV